MTRSSRLLTVFSFTPHRRTASGELAGWGPTVREIDSLATIFSAVRHVSVVEAGTAPDSFVPYRQDNVHVVGLRPAGGAGMAGKLSALAALPRYVAVVWRELRRADIVHARTPDNVALVAVLLLCIRRHPKDRWVKYAGNWRPDRRDGLLYRMQRRILRWNWPRALVTVNGEWQGDGAHVRPFFNPCMTAHELEEARSSTAAKMLGDTLSLVFVGRLEEAKGVTTLLQVAAVLRQLGCRFHLDLIGDGPDRARYEEMVESLELGDVVTFRGWLPSERIHDVHRKAHLLLLPTETEGFPKVIAEAMSHRVVPIATAVSSIPQILDELGCGWTVPPGDTNGYVETILNVQEHPADWRRAADAGAAGATRFTFEAYLDAVKDLLHLESNDAVPDAGPG